MRHCCKQFSSDPHLSLQNWKISGSPSKTKDDPGVQLLNVIPKTSEVKIINKNFIIDR